MSNEWECVVVGGGAAGLSAALVLGRARRRTLVVDADSQSNRAASVTGGVLGFDQRPPAELYAAGRRELLSYPSVEYRAGEVVGGTRVEEGVELDLDNGHRVHAQRVLLATGMQYCRIQGARRHHPDRQRALVDGPVHRRRPVGGRRTRHHQSRSRRKQAT